MEASLNEVGWHLARHLDLILPAAAQMSTEEDRELAAKTKLRALKVTVIAKDKKPPNRKSAAEPPVACGGP